MAGLSYPVHSIDQFADPQQRAQANSLNLPRSGSLHSYPDDYLSNDHLLQRFSSSLQGFPSNETSVVGATVPDLEQYIIQQMRGTAAQHSLPYANQQSSLALQHQLVGLSWQPFLQQTPLSYTAMELLASASGQQQAAVERTTALDTSRRHGQEGTELLARLVNMGAPRSSHDIELLTRALELERLGRIPMPRGRRHCCFLSSRLCIFARRLLHRKQWCMQPSGKNSSES
jgi:hypothetical protein